MLAIKAPPPRTSPATPRRIVKPPEYVYAGPVQPPDIPAVVLSLSNGLPAEEISPELYGTLVPFMDKQIAAYNHLKNTLAAENLKNAKEYFFRPKTAEVKKREPVVEEYIPTEQEIEEAFARVENGMPLTAVKEEIVPYLIPLYREKIAQALANRAYQLAESYEIGVRKVHTFVANKEERERAIGNKARLMEKLEIAKETLADIRLDCEERMYMLEEEMNRSRAEMEALFRQELENISVSKQKPKYSVKVLQLEQRQRYMRRAGNNDDADILKKESEALKAIEVKAFQEKLAADYVNRKNDMLRGQDRRRRIFDSKWHRKVHEVAKANETYIQHQLKAIHHLEDQIRKADQKYQELSFTGEQQHKAMTPRVVRRYKL